MKNTTINNLRVDIVSRQKFLKQDLIRVVLNKNKEIFIDETNQANGRGCYIKKELESIQVARKKNLLSKSLKTKIDDLSIYDKLESVVTNES